jgi:hypothetical protein
VTGRPQIAMADAQYWKQQHMDEVIVDQQHPSADSARLGCPHDPSLRLGWRALRSALASRTGKATY